MRIVVIAAMVALAALAGCNRRNRDEDTQPVRSSTIVAPENTPVDAVPQEEPAVARSLWRSANETARTGSGNLRVSLESVRGGPVVFAFANGVTIRAQPYQQIQSSSRSGVGGQSYAAVLGGDPRVDAWLYRVLDENVASSASRGLCGDGQTRFMAVSEFVDGTGRWVFKIATFRGEHAPGGGSGAPELCGAYAYSAQ